MSPRRKQGRPPKSRMKVFWFYGRTFYRPDRIVAETLGLSLSVLREGRAWLAAQGYLRLSPLPPADGGGRDGVGAKTSAKGRAWYASALSLYGFDPSLTMRPLAPRAGEKVITGTVSPRLDGTTTDFTHEEWQRFSRDMNKAEQDVFLAIMRLARQHGEYTDRQVAERTGYRVKTVMEVTAQLVKKDYFKRRRED